MGSNSNSKSPFHSGCKNRSSPGIKHNIHSHHVLDSPTVQCEGTKEERANNKSLLIQQYHHFSAKPGESFKDLYDRFNTLITDLKLFGKTYDNYQVNLKFIQALPSSWANRTTAITLYNDMDDMPLHKLFEKLNKYELEDKKYELIQQYHKFTAKPGESITELFDRFNRLVNDVRLLGRTCDNYEVNLKFLQALPSSWNNRTVAICECNDMDAMPLQKLYEKLNTYELEDKKDELIRQYHKFTAKRGESITELFDRFNRLVNDLRLFGRTCHNYEVNLKFLQALPSSWDNSSIAIRWDSRTVAIRECNDMHAMPLQKLYEKLNEYDFEDKKHVLLQQYHQFTAKSGESITELFDRFNILVNDLRLFGRTCDNYEVNKKFIQALQSSWDKWTVAIRECNDMHAMPLQKLYEKLRTYELEDQQRKALKQYHKNKALAAEGKDWVDSDNSDMCSQSQSKLRSKVYTSKH